MNTEVQYVIQRADMSTVFKLSLAAIQNECWVIFIDDALLSLRRFEIDAGPVYVRFVVDTVAVEHSLPPPSRYYPITSISLLIRNFILTLQHGRLTGLVTSYVETAF